ncbi:MAG: hypothetical protein IJS32_07120 [Kiritimatiellae bacterium]|nr:hypothetical protein [Kiritimatiellia bacterium]
MEDAILSVSTPGVDAAALVASIRESVAKKAAAGAYDDARVAVAERTNLLALQGDGDFMEFFLHSLRQSVFVDIGDIEIQEKRRFFTGFFVKLKKGIWALLRFYTYRLWSQQNQTNGILVTALEGLWEKSKAREAELVKRIEALEKRLDGRP